MTVIASSQRSPRCAAVRPDGTPCRAWAVRGSDPPLCNAHAAAAQRRAGPALSTTTRPPQPVPDRPAAARQSPALAAAALPTDPPGPLSLSDEIAIARLTLHRAVTLLDSPDLDIADLAHLAGLVLSGTRIVARLLRDQRAISGTSADGIAGAIAQALDEMGTEWGLSL